MIRENANQLMNYLSGSGWMTIVVGIAILALALVILMKLAKKYGILPFLAIALLAGAYFAWPQGSKQPAATVTLSEEPLAKNRGILANLFGKVTSPEGGTRVKNSWEEGDSFAACGYCKKTMIIGGRKGKDIIRCPECGATMPAQKAIWYYKLIEQRGY
jgi:hypothetical protein